MSRITPLPEPVRKLLNQNTHPGLMLDKYVESWDETAPPGKLSERVQKPALQAVVNLSRQAPSCLDLGTLLERRRRMLDDLGAQLWRCTTVGPLTLHLARASALENAGICLHPIYGFVYLPGSGLKGMARAYAETVAKAPREQLEAVFGNEPGEPQQDRQHAGAVVFHDGWPETWPPLIVDILNNHHAGYYQGKDAPGDWDSPIPIYFLAVPAGQRFSFAVSGCRADVDSGRLVELARQWLTGALTHEGAGAKTATGYGRFRPENETPPRLSSSARVQFRCTLELVTPAFLAGANQQTEDCDLRPATLRGLLRWWWRTLHAGFVDVPTLRQMEAALWGDTRTGGAVRLHIEPAAAISPLPYDRMWTAQQNRLPRPGNSKTTQGLWYHSYGMDEKKGRRLYLPPGTRWHVGLSARRTWFPADAKADRAQEIEADLVLEQARAALWLLCQLGGVGSKSRKGFGCLADLPDLTLAACKEAAGRFRASCGLTGPFREGLAKSPALEQLLTPGGGSLPWLEIVTPTPWPNYWALLDCIGDAAQQFAQSRKHQLDKKALGPPRKVGAPTQGAFRPGPEVADRHASPVLYHAAATGSGYSIRVAFFPAALLPDLGRSRQFLHRLLAHLQQNLQGLLQARHAIGKTSPVLPRPAALTAPASAGPSSPAPPPAPRAGDCVEAELLKDKTKAGGWKARHASTGLSGPIINTADVPADLQPGAKVQLLIASINPQTISFRWPGPRELAKQPAPPAGKQPPQKGRR